MRAAICTAYGPPEVLQVRDVPKPIPGRRDLLIRIHAAAVTVSECYIRSGVPTAPLWYRAMVRIVIGFTKPRAAILGSVLAGEVEQTGTAVRRFHVGDRVFAFTMLRQGAYAEYACVAESAKVTAAPRNLTPAEAAALPYGGLIALYFLRRAGVGQGQHVFIYGASGAIGTIAVQLAKHFGAHVTAACGPTNLDLVKSLGADAVVDYSRDTMRADMAYDRVIDAVGRRKTSPLKVALQSAFADGGRYVSVDDKLPRITTADLAFLAELAEQGVLKPVIDRGFPLEQIADAHRYVEQGHKKGNVIIEFP